MYGRFEYPLRGSSTKFFDEFRAFTTAIRSPDSDPHAIILTDDEESSTYVMLKLIGVKNIKYQKME